MTTDAEPPAIATCCGCGRKIEAGGHYRTRDGDWHQLCWQKKCNDYYYEQTLDSDEASDD